MFTINTYEYECTNTCTSLEHGKTINCALRNRSVSDSKLAAFIAKTCRNFTDVVDCAGRSSLHLAASVNRYRIAEWLINNGANINLKNTKSLKTPLHRAICYGNISIAVLLLKFGASLDVVDSIFKTPLQYTCNPKVYRGQEIMWCANRNNNLGLVYGEEGNQPQQIEVFRKNNIIIAQVSISVFHTIFLTDNGDIYVVGHGESGRLGNGVKNTLVPPKKVQIVFKHAGEKIISISAGRCHSLILTDRCNVYTTGTNNYLQMSKSIRENILQFTEISNLMKINGKNMRGVIAHDTYSLVYNSSEIFVWGTNSGQFGVEKKQMHPITDLQELPINNIELFDSGNTVITCYTNKKYFYVFSEYKTKRFKTPNLEEIVQLLVGGNDTRNFFVINENFRILILTESHSLYIWDEDNPEYLKCVFPVVEFSIDRLVRCSKHVVIMSKGDMYIVNPIQLDSDEFICCDYRGTFINDCICNKKATERCVYRKTFINDCICNIELTPMAYASHALDVLDDVIDETKRNFIILQKSPLYYLDIPSLDESVPSFQKLLDRANENDALHDVIFHVDNQKFVAHKYIVSCRAPGLGEFITHSPGKKHIHINYARLTGTIFQAILNYIYTNQCLSVNEISQLYPANLDKKDALNCFRLLLTRFQINDYTIDDNGSNKITQTFPKVDRKLYPEYHDVTIKCLNNQIIKAHKCILVDRLEYFNIMFDHTWSENEVNLSNISIDYMEVIINWLYTNDFHTICNKKLYSQNFIYQMIILCDQFVINDLKQHYELLLLGRLNVNNCGDILELSNYYNCSQLEDNCLKYICCNIDQVLELGSLNNLELGMLNKINRRYSDLFSSIQQRVPPYSDAIDDEYIEAFVNNFEINFSTTASGNDNGNSSDDDFELSKSGKICKKDKNKLKWQRRERIQEPVKYEKNIFHGSSNKDENKSAEINSNLVEQPSNTSPAIVDKEKNMDLWTTVIDKKIESTKSKKLLKANEILKNEKKGTNKFVNLNLFHKNGSSTNNIQSSNSSLQEENDVTSPGRNIISLADFTPIKRDKLSQKQRKRLSFQTSPITVAPTKPVIDEKLVVSPPPITENVWKSLPPINKPPATRSSIFPSLTSPILPKRDNHILKPKMRSSRSILDLL